MAVRTQVPWWGRGFVVAVLVALIGGRWWWGFDFGRIFGGVTHREAESRVATLAADNEALRAEAAQLRARNSKLESELAMARGEREATARQTADAVAENVQLKEETAFLRQLFADTNQQPGMAMPRLGIERQSDDVWRYSLLIVRGGNPRDEFAGRVVLLATLAGTDANGTPTQTLTLPDDEPETAPMLKLRFKYYQRVEGTFRTPAGARVTALEARAFETGSGSPRASRTVTAGP
jgi:hypothetical protein